MTDDYLADVVAAGEPQERATEVLLDADAGSGVLTWEWRQNIWEIQTMLVIRLHILDILVQY